MCCLLILPVGKNLELIKLPRSASKEYMTKTPDSDSPKETMREQCKSSAVLGIILVSTITSCALQPGKPIASKSATPTNTPLATTPSATPSISPAPVIPPAPSVTPIVTKPFLTPSSTTLSNDPFAIGSPSSQPSPSSTSTATTVKPTGPYEEQAQVEEGWQTVKIYKGSGMTNFCPAGDTFKTKSAWRLRWRVGQINNTKLGNGNMSIEIINKSNAKDLPMLESSNMLSEFTSQTFPASGNTFCLLARSNRTSYTILVEEQSKPQATKAP
jgi:hypothetical protein